MKHIVLILAFLANGSIFAELPGTPPVQRDVVDCLDWSGLTFCKKWFGNQGQLGAQCSLCVSNHGANGFEVFSSYTNNPDQAPTRYWSIYVKYCYQFAYGSVAGPHHIPNDKVVDTLAGIFDHGVLVSEYVEDTDGLHIYILDQAEGRFFDSTWDSEGNLVDFGAIEPDAEHPIYERMEDWGLSFTVFEAP